MGTMIQRHALTEAEYRGERFRDSPRDLRGNNDLLNLTRPDVIRAIHAEYLEAGADILETNTFNSTAISQADYGLEAIVHELNLAGARLAREAADAASARTPAQAALRGRRAGPDEPHALALARRERPGLPRGHLRPGDATLTARRWRALVEGGVDLIMVETIFDTLNAKAALFAIDEHFEASGRAAAHHDLGHHHRCLGPHALGPDRGGLLEFRAPREAAVHRLQLRAGRAPAASPRRGARAHRRRVRLGAPQRGPAQRDGGVRRAARRDRRLPARLGRERLAQHHRRLLRHHARPHPRHRRGGAGVPAARRAGNRRAAAPLGPRAARHRRRLALRERGRAHQRHRLQGLLAPRPRRRLLGRALGRAPAGGQRRPGDRHQHGRGDARLAGGDDALPAARGRRARHRAGSRDDRQLQVERDRGGVEVRAGQVDRELDLAQGRRGGVHPPGEARAPLRRGRGRDGVRREGPGRFPCAQDLHLPALLQDPHGAGRLPARGHHLRREHLRHRHRHRGALDLRRRLHRGGGVDPPEPAARQDFGRRVQPLVLVPRQRPGARGDAHRLPLPRDACRHDDGHRQRGAARRLRRDPRGPAGAGRGRDPQPPRRRHRAPGRVRRELQGAEEGPGRGARMAQGPGEGAHRPRAGEGHHRVHRRGHRGGAPRARAPAAGDRGPAHGRHERRGRPLRLGQDVPSPGRQVGARDEAGGRAPDSLHRGGEAAARHRAQAQGQGRDGDGQGRRARHRQEHRGRRAPVQQLRRRGPGRHGRVRDHPRDGAARERRFRRPLGPHHPVTRGNGPRRQGDAAPGLHAAAPDRRGHHVAHAYGGEDRAQLQGGADGVGAGCFARGRRGHQPLLRGAARGLSRGSARRLREDPRAARAQDRAEECDA